MDYEKIVERVKLTDPWPETSLCQYLQALKYFHDKKDPLSSSNTALVVLVARYILEKITSLNDETSEDDVTQIRTWLTKNTQKLVNSDDYDEKTSFLIAKDFFFDTYNEIRKYLLHRGKDGSKHEEPELIGTDLVFAHLGLLADALQDEIENSKWNFTDEKEESQFQLMRSVCHVTMDTFTAMQILKVKGQSTYDEIFDKFMFKHIYCAHRVNAVVSEYLTKYKNLSNDSGEFQHVIMKCSHCGSDIFEEKSDFKDDKNEATDPLSIITQNINKDCEIAY